MLQLTILLASAFWRTFPETNDHPALGLRVPAGFEVAEYAGPGLANDVFSFTFDPHGRVVVSGRGYIRILVDDDRNGTADRAINFADGPADGAQGMLWEGKSLLVTGDGGLRRYRDEDNDGYADGPSELIRALKTGGEHDAHDIKRGPDNWLYVLCGNMTGIDGNFASYSSPIREPVAGCVVRFSPDFSTTEIVADGLRNAYRMDFNDDGALFTYDSDNERCVSLPWYEPTRFYHILTGRHFGWLAPQRGQFWRLPPYLIDVAPPIAYLGRGSPTGVACYRSSQFPAEYRSGFFLADWTFGRIHFVRMSRTGSTFSGEPRLFLEAIGENGFAPTDLSVHPETGDLFVAIGGRGTRGALYRVRYPAGHVGINAPPKRDVTAFVNPSLDQVVHGDAVVRLKALDAIRRHFRDTSQDDVRVAVLANWDDADRNVRLACVPLIDRLGRDHVSLLEASARQPLAAATLALGCVQSNPQLSVRTACDVISAPTSLNAARLDAVRAIQLVLGDIGSPRLSGTIWEGYTARAPLGGPDSGTVRPELAALIRSTFAKSFPSGDPSVDRELARVLAMLEDGNRTTLSKILRFITADSSPEDDIHYLAVLARLRAPRTEQATLLVAQALLALDRKCEQQKKNRDRNWLLRVGELYSELASKDSELNERLLSDSDFGRPDHVVFVRGDGTSRVWAASRFIARSKTDPEFAWSARLVELVGELPGDDAAPVLRDLWQNVALRDSILRVLARQADLVDRDKFIAGLESGQIDTVANCLSALERLPEPDDPNELLELVRTTRRLSDGNEEIRLRERVGKLLQARTGETIAPGDTGAWTEWLEGRYPKLAVRLSGNDAVDPGTWRRRLGEINWSTGSAAQGRFVFSRAGCLACHSGPRAIGPDLRGVASRFSIGDLFQAIVQPSRDVSPRYQTTRVATADGRAHQGVIIYEAVDSLILQTAADATVRINASQIVERRVTTSSIMPAGLIDELTDSQIADLYAYLKSAM